MPWRCLSSDGSSSSSAMPSRANRLNSFQTGDSCSSAYAGGGPKFTGKPEVLDLHDRRAAMFPQPARLAHLGLLLSGASLKFRVVAFCIGTLVSFGDCGYASDGHQISAAVRDGGQPRAGSFGDFHSDPACLLPPSRPIIIAMDIRLRTPDSLSSTAPVVAVTNAAAPLPRRSGPPPAAARFCLPAK